MGEWFESVGIESRKLPSTGLLDLSTSGYPTPPRENSGLTLVLASGSATRAKLLTAAGVAFTVDVPSVDEPALRAKASGGAAAAQVIAEQKALAVATRRPSDWVIGSDQVLQIGPVLLGKPGSWREARNQLQVLRGRTHELITTVAVARSAGIVWHHTEVAHLTVRAFSNEALDRYEANAGDAVLSSPGAYHLEGLGASLFEQVRGDYFSILGLPLLPLMAYLRSQDVLPQ